MPIYILKLLFKAYLSKETLTAEDQMALHIYESRCDQQEFNYYIKLNEAFFANK